MPGGRPPMPEEELSRPRYGQRAAEFGEVERVTATAQPLVPPLDPSPDWHPTAVMLWESFVASPVSAARWLSTDWALAWWACDELTAHLTGAYSRNGRRSAAALGEIRQLLIGLGLTDMERRRARLEVVYDDDRSEFAALLAEARRESDRLMLEGSADGNE